ncbi:PREDICTED: uncharacterized protein LOC104803791 [Tarenaya hassleriana]|uniref:uncharacterized protein LOC104803791 n=1 Tax=Tarenaya hassleriana TaxID=28532 RepID=UPI00053C141C|nr:PREDICTED: uncharacterized protein LOC104803791 [Tarenaya hassleriana]
MEVMTVPSSPRHLSGGFFSTPTSPRRVAEFYRDFEDYTSTQDLSSEPLFIPFDWEVKPGTPKSPTSKINTLVKDDDDDDDGGGDDDFAFDLGDRSETASLFAEELFDGGKIKPLKPPPRLQIDELEQFKKTSPLSSPRSPISQGKNLLRKAFSPKKMKPVDVDPFKAALEKARNGSRRGRGREQSHGSNQRASRSLSPFRVSAYPWEEEEQDQERERKKKEESESSLKEKGSFSSALSSVSSSSRKWRLRDLILFRSASEGRAKQKDSISRFASFFKRQEEPVKNSSVGRSRGTSSSVSSHGLYMARKAESKDAKKRTFLPYKPIGRFAF